MDKIILKGARENNLKNINKIPNTTIVYRLWTLSNGKLDKKSTEIVNKIEKYYKLSPEVVDKIKKEANVKIFPNIYVDKDNQFEWPKVTNHKSCGFCYALKTHIAILVDGTVVPCCLDNNGDIPLGNILEEDLETILNKPISKTIKENFGNSKITCKLCKTCGFLKRLENKRGHNENK